MNFVRTHYHQFVKSPTFWLAIVLAILFYVVMQEESQREQDAREITEQIWQSNIDSCHQFSIPTQLDNAESHRDQATFAGMAAEARRGDGDEAVALGYEGVEARALERESRARQRASVPCEERFPRPEAGAEEGE
jgi:hypothetical protein